MNCSTCDKQFTISRPDRGAPTHDDPATWEQPTRAVRGHGMRHGLRDRSLAGLRCIEAGIAVKTSISQRDSVTADWSSPIWTSSTMLQVRLDQGRDRELVALTHDVIAFPMPGL